MSSLADTNERSQGWSLCSLRELHGRSFAEVVAHYRAQVSAVDLGYLESALADALPGARLVRAVVFAAPDTDVTAPSDLPYIVLGAQHGGVNGATVELQAVVPDASAAFTIGTTPTSHTFETSEQGLRLRRSSIAVRAEMLEQAAAPIAAAFARIESELKAADMRPEHIVRTWFFMGDIAHDYDELNATRNAFFDRWQLSKLPASTGIGAALPGKGPISVMVDAVSHDGGPSAEPYEATPTLQCAPASYGSRFVRANRVRVNGTETLHISGISSIDSSGRSIVTKDPYDAVAFTMASLEDLLVRGGEMSFEHIASSYAYCKSAAVAKAFDRYLIDRDLHFPHMRTFVDVCRPELVFEIEARAFRTIDPVTATSPDLP
jgi:enamine deaminase RidA (YjgF/YER057c/UK114 family)